jgi:hypothetical protein
MNAVSSSALIQQWFVVNDERSSSLVARWGPEALTGPTSGRGPSPPHAPSHHRWGGITVACVVGSGSQAWAVRSAGMTSPATFSKIRASDWAASGRHEPGQ